MRRSLFQESSLGGMQWPNTNTETTGLGYLQGTREQGREDGEKGREERVKLL